MAIEAATRFKTNNVIETNPINLISLKSHTSNVCDLILAEVCKKNINRTVHDRWTNIVKKKLRIVKAQVVVEEFGQRNDK